MVKSKADKMFKELGYPIFEETEKYIKYYDGVFSFILFDKETIGTRESLYYVSLDIHLAKHEKMKELGWIK